MEKKRIVIAGEPSEGDVRESGVENIDGVEELFSLDESPSGPGDSVGEVESTRDGGDVTTRGRKYGDWLRHGQKFPPYNSSDRQANQKLVFSNNYNYEDISPTIATSRTKKTSRLLFLEASTSTRQEVSSSSLPSANDDFNSTTNTQRIFQSFRVVCRSGSAEEDDPSMVNSTVLEGDIGSPSSSSADDPYSPRILPHSRSGGDPVDLHHHLIHSDAGHTPRRALSAVECCSRAMLSRDDKTNDLSSFSTSEAYSPLLQNILLRRRRNQMMSMESCLEEEKTNDDCNSTRHHDDSEKRKEELTSAKFSHKPEPAVAVESEPNCSATKQQHLYNNTASVQPSVQVPQSASIDFGDNKDDDASVSKTTPVVVVGNLVPLLRSQSASASSFEVEKRYNNSKDGGGDESSSPNPSTTTSVSSIVAVDQMRGGPLSLSLPGIFNRRSPDRDDEHAASTLRHPLGFLPTWKEALSKPQCPPKIKWKDPLFEYIEYPQEFDEDGMEEWLLAPSSSISEDGTVSREENRNRQNLSNPIRSEKEGLALLRKKPSTPTSTTRIVSICDNLDNE